MISNKPYSAVADFWALGVIIARLLSPSSPPGYEGDVGPRWGAAVVAQF